MRKAGDPVVSIHQRECTTSNNAAYTSFNLYNSAMASKPKRETKPKYDPDFLYEGLPLFTREETLTAGKTQQTETPKSSLQH